MVDFQLNLTKITFTFFMDKFVTRVTDSVYRRNLRIDSIRDESKKESEVERRVDRDKEREIRHKADHAAAMRLFRANRAAKISETCCNN